MVQRNTAVVIEDGYQAAVEVAAFDGHMGSALALQGQGVDLLAGDLGAQVRRGEKGTLVQ